MKQMDKLEPGIKCVSTIYGTLPENTDVYVLGFGGSLRYFPFQLLDNKVVVGVNDMLKIYPIDYHYFSDTGLAARYQRLQISKRTKAVVCQRHGVQTFKRNGFSGMDRVLQCQHAAAPTLKDSPFLFCRRTVACGGIELAWKIGARTIYMLGIDGCRPPASYYADGSASRWRRSISPKGSISSLTKRTERLKGRGSLDVVKNMIDKYQIEIEDRHLDWYEDFCALRVHFQSMDSPPRIVNLSPVSIFDQFEIEDPYEHFGITKKEWRLTNE